MAFAWVGLAAVGWGIYGTASSIWGRYTEHAAQQAENLWLHTHCMENERLRAHTDACDRIRPLFEETPLAFAFQPWLKTAMEWHRDAQDFVMAHHYAFLLLWLMLFLLLPQLLISPFRKQDRAEALRRQISASASFRKRSFV